MILKKVVRFALPAAVLAVMPLGQKPHLIEKLEFLFQGTLTKPIDIFDLILHGGLILVTIGYLVYLMLQKKAEKQEEAI